MELYLIRHGIAAEPENYANDWERPLTEEGIRKTKKVAQHLSKLSLNFDLILSSPLIRAQQTAAILKQQGLSEHIQESAELAPDGDINTWLSWLNEWRSHKINKSLAIVGHQPDLTNWAEILVWGETNQKLILKKAGVIGLELPTSNLIVGNCQMFLLTPPKWLI